MAVKAKNWYKSKTILLAFAQAIASVLVVFFLEYPELRVVGGVGLFKSALDIYIRFNTDEALKK